MSKRKRTHKALSPPDTGPVALPKRSRKKTPKKPTIAELEAKFRAKGIKGLTPTEARQLASMAESPESTSDREVFARAAFDLASEARAIMPMVFRELVVMATQERGIAKFQALRELRAIHSEHVGMGDDDVDIQWEILDEETA